MKWSSENFKFLEENINKYSNQELADILNKTKGAIKRKIFLLGLKRKKENKIIYNCLNCNNKFEGYESHNRKFCSSSCAASYNNKNRNPEIYRNHSLKLQGRGRTKKIFEVKCVVCEKRFETSAKRKRVKTCSSECKFQLVSENSSKLHLELAKNINRRIFLRDIGRKGGFGKKGVIEGIRYDSTLERDCFKLVLDRNLKFVPHKPIPNSSKISDLFLEDRNLYIELDGINREKRKKWLGKDYEYWIEKLKIYKENNLEFRIFYSFKEFKNFIEG